MAGKAESWVETVVIGHHCVVLLIMTTTNQPHEPNGPNLRPLPRSDCHPYQGHPYPAAEHVPVPRGSRSAVWLVMAGSALLILVGLTGLILAIVR